MTVAVSRIELCDVGGECNVDGAPRGSAKPELPEAMAAALRLCSSARDTPKRPGFSPFRKGRASRDDPVVGWAFCNPGLGTFAPQDARHAPSVSISPAMRTDGLL